MNGRSPARAIWLLARLRLLRLLNMTSAIRFGKAANAKSRAASRGKSSSRWLLGATVGLGMLFSFATLSKTSLLNLHCKLDMPSACAAVLARQSAERMQEMAGAQLHAAQFSPALAAAMTLMLLLMWLVSFLLPLGSHEMAQADWDLEWLVTLPVKRATLLWARLLERSVANPIGILALWPLCTVLAWFGNHGPVSPLLGAAVALPLLMLAALMRTLADTGLRLSLPPSQLRNLQALASVLSMPLMYAGISFSIWSNNSFTLDWARAFPAWTLWTPPGLAVQALTAHAAPNAALAVALLLVQTAALLAAGMALLHRQLRHGVVATGAREAAGRNAKAALAGRAAEAALTCAAAVSVPGLHVAAAMKVAGDEGPTGPAAASGAAVAAAAGTAAAGAPPRRGAWRAWRPWRLGTILQRRELLLLGRDRNFLAQSLLIPVVLIVSQLLVSGQLSSVTLLGQNQQLMAAIGFGIGSYVLLLSAFQAINTEGHALWMLYTFPRPIGSLLKEKAQLWGVLAALYPLLVFAIGLYYTPDFNWRLLAYAAIVMAGIPVYALIAVSLGVFASNPQAQDAQSRVRPAYAYLYMMLCSLYTYALYAPEWTQTLSIIILTSSLALALWQKAHDELPYLLDPAAAPPARVALSDGLIAATLFFVLQGLVGMMLGGPRGKPEAGVVAFVVAGATVYALVRYLYWRHKTIGVPALLNGKLSAAAGHALLGAVAACAFGAAYLWLLRDTPWWPRHAPRHIHLVLPLTVLAAPLFEEFIFRGLIFGGLRRLAGALPAAAASAALFAIVHPSLAMLPVFVLGLCTAWAYERSKSLLAPMLVHAAYNAMVVGVQVALIR
ncbi:CPBP family intramembrane metalloprotease [Pseudoduganella sp. LjRoot289]|uniref:CPBP family intramembrane glutamic endopeptidase n=1 Tax=Pseudoduganella sp. LjRoot289 TaxID=3342314 RepID=UPI003ECDD52C